MTRPAAAIPYRDRRYLPRTTADVHGRRGDAALAHPHPRLQQLAEWLTPAFYVDFGRPCNSACLYCAVPPHEDAQGFAPLDQVVAMAAAGKAVGCDRAILIGGEPTIYPHLPEVFEILREFGLERHICMTNGLKLADRVAVQQLVAGGVATVHLSLDTWDEATYNRLARSKGQFHKQLTALDNLLAEPRLNLYIYTALTAVNGPTLRNLVRQLADRAQLAGIEAPPLILAVVKPLGDALRHAGELLIAPQQAAELVRDLVALGNDLGVAVGHRNLQACLAPELVDRNVDYYLDDFSVDVATGARKPFGHSEYWFHPPSCEGCGHRAVCPGLYRDTVGRYGQGGYAAIGSTGLAGRESAQDP